MFSPHTESARSLAAHLICRAGALPKIQHGKLQHPATMNPATSRRSTTVERHLDYPDIPYHMLLRTSAARWPDKTAIVFGDQRITFERLDRMPITLPPRCLPGPRGAQGRSPGNLHAE